MVNGGLILPKKTVAGTIEVSWDWYGDSSQGVVQWTFTNNSPNFVSGLLYRVNYPFGNAFWPIYAANSAFQTSFTTLDTPLIDNGVESNSPPLAVFQNPDKSLFVAFLFSLQAGQEWSMLEGGFVNGMTPSMDNVPTFVYATKLGIKSYAILWDPEQCQGYNEQSGSNLPCPIDPISVISALFSISTQITPLFNDIISNPSSSTPAQPPQTCAEMFIDGIVSLNAEKIEQAFQCAFGDLTSEWKAVIREAMKDDDVNE